MSAGLQGKKPLLSKPPDKGSFPLDHDGECKPIMIQYMECLSKKDCVSDPCRDIAQAYLQCRMDRELMAKEDWKNLGFDDNK